MNSRYPAPKERDAFQQSEHVELRSRLGWDPDRCPPGLYMSRSLGGAAIVAVQLAKLKDEMVLFEIELDFAGMRPQGG